MVMGIIVEKSLQGLLLALTHSAIPLAVLFHGIGDLYIPRREWLSVILTRAGWLCVLCERFSYHLLFKFERAGREARFCWTILLDLS